MFGLGGINDPYGFSHNHCAMTGGMPVAGGNGGGIAGGIGAITGVARSRNFASRFRRDQTTKAMSLASEKTVTIAELINGYQTIICAGLAEACLIKVGNSTHELTIPTTKM